MKQKVNIQVLIKNFGIILVLILSFWAIKPLFVSGFFPMHDNTQVARVYEMGKMLGEGIFPVRWVPDLGYGYGYPIFNFYAPLAYYAGGAFMLLGFDALLATKMMMVLGILLSGIFMYFLAREFFGELGGIVSGLFYLYAPYHAVDIYVRGDVAEFWAYAFIPLAFYGLYKIYNDYKHDKKNLLKWILIGSLGYAGVILSHNLTAMMITPFLLAFILILGFISYKAKKIFTIYYLLFTIFLGLVLSAFYWLPALLELKNTNVLSQIGGGANFLDHFICLSQLWSGPWGFGGSAKGCIDGMSFMIGKFHVVASVIALMLMFVGYKHYIIFLSFAGFVLTIFFTLELSKPIWQVIPAMAFFQYPWRFLIMTSFFSSFLSGFTVWFFKKTESDSYINTLMYCSGAILVFSLLFLNLKFFVPQTIFPAKASDFTNETALKWVASKTSDEFLPLNFKKPKSEYEIGEKPIEFKETAVEKTSNLVSFIGALALIAGIIFKYAKTKR